VVKVRPRFTERLLFRSETEVRRALFGPPELPGLALSSEDKERRLGAVACAAMKRSAEARAQTALSERARSMAAQSAEALLTAFVAALARHVERELARLANPLEELTARVQELRGLREALTALERAVQRADAGLNEVAGRFPAAAAMLVPRARTAEPAVPGEHAARRSRPAGEPSAGA
jgi:hypothetical protein